MGVSGYFGKKGWKYQKKF